jgi:polygalacturonase
VLDGGGTVNGNGQVRVLSPLMLVIILSTHNWSRCGTMHCKYSSTARSRYRTADRSICSASNSSLVRPIVLTVFQGTNVQIKNIHIVQSPEWNNLVWQSKNVLYDNININAKSTSSHGAANTDGWNVYQSDTVTIQNSVIVNGDDCVAFKPSPFYLYSSTGI